MKDLSFFDKSEIREKWLYNSKEQVKIACDYMEKLGYSIADLELACKQINHRANIIYIVTMFAWIFDITEHFINKPSEYPKGIQSIIREDVINGFSYSKKDDLKNAKKYMRSLRSFLLAHPLNTTNEEHKKFDLDGKYFSVDVGYLKDSSLYKLLLDEDFRHLDYSGMHIRRIDSDIFIKAYPTDISNNPCGVYIGFSLDDISRGVDLCIDALKELNSYLLLLKKERF